MKIGDININNPILLAPMAGVTDYPFRILCKEMGAAIVYSEFVSADGIIRENSKIYVSREWRKKNLENNEIILKELIELSTKI